MRQAIVILLCLALRSRASGLSFDDPDKNVSSQIDDMEKFFEDEARTTQSWDKRRVVATIKANPKKLSKNFWQDGAEDPYKRAKALEEAKALAGSGLVSIGSSVAPQLEQELFQAGEQMIATGDPQFSTLGSDLKQERVAIQSGNQDAAQTLANEVNSAQGPDLSGYTPSASDVAYGNAADQAAAQVAAVAVTAVGTIAGAAIGTYCTGIGGTEGAEIGLALGSAVGSAIESSAGSTNSGNLAQVGAQAASSAIGQSGNKAAQSITFQNQNNGAPSQGGSVGTSTAPTGSGSIGGNSGPSSGNSTGALPGAI